jgi:multiple antibiotic resistance protein
MGWHQFVGTTLLLYGLINPIGVIPIYSHLVREDSSQRAHRILLIASVAVGGLLILAALWGQPILAFFNVGLDDFRIAGGLLALVIAFEMFQARYGAFLQTLEERAEADTDIHGIAITPLAFPLLVGPAEMSVIITLSNDTSSFWAKGMLVAAVVFTTALTALTLYLAKPLGRMLGTTGINVVTRVMALIVASVAIDFILSGLRNQFPGLR